MGRDVSASGRWRRVVLGAERIGSVRCGEATTGSARAVRRLQHRIATRHRSRDSVTRGHRARRRGRRRRRRSCQAVTRQRANRRRRGRWDHGRDRNRRRLDDRRGSRRCRRDLRIRRGRRGRHRARRLGLIAVTGRERERRTEDDPAHGVGASAFAERAVALGAANMAAARGAWNEGRAAHDGRHRIVKHGARPRLWVLIERPHPRFRAPLSRRRHRPRVTVGVGGRGARRQPGVRSRENATGEIKTAARLAGGERHCSLPVRRAIQTSCQPPDRR